MIGGEQAPHELKLFEIDETLAQSLHPNRGHRAWVYEEGIARRKADVPCIAGRICRPVVPGPAQETIQFIGGGIPAHPVVFGRGENGKSFGKAGTQAMQKMLV